MRVPETESNKKPLKVLLVEDSEDDALLLLRELRQGGYDPVSERVDTASALDAALDGRVWDVIISDYRMPRFNGLAALKLMQGRGLDVPFILVSGAIGEELAVEAMKTGAHDYLLKGNLARLAPAVERELGDAEARRQRKRAEEEIFRLNAELEQRVARRTSELESVNERLRREIVERSRLEGEILQISERELARVGLDLHDNLCQILTGIAFMTEGLANYLAAKKLPPATAALTARNLAKLIRKAIDEAHTLTRNLYLVWIEDHGLMSALNELAATTSRHFDIACAFKCDEPVTIRNSQSATHLYRIAQEAVGNAIQHGKAQSVEIGLAASDHTITLAIKDNGVGLPKKSKKPGMGMRTMNYRAQAAGGTLEIRPRVRRGTEVICSFPKQ